MKKLSEICKRLSIVETNVTEDYEITGIAVNSQNVKSGYLFVVTEGNEKYIGEAFGNGAVCLMADKAYYYPCVKVENIRESLALACSDFYDNPEKKIKIIGVVGTNGKTSVTYILNEIFKPYKKTAIIGTLGIIIDDEKIDNPMTTPDPPLFYYALWRAVECGVEYVFCEITAHSIYYNKLYGARCEICVFTNISRDHLDFFDNMDNYYNVKKSFFVKENVKIGVINSDDKLGRDVIENSNICSVSYGIEQPSDVFAIDVTVNNGIKFVANAFDDIIFVNTRFEGRFNVYNILASISVARLAGISARDIQSRLRMMTSIEGRVELISQSPKVIIDFAHTPDGLGKVLSSLKETVTGKLITVFGCGGNRDEGKRPIMGKIATELSDVCVITSDNPRYEDPQKIIEQIIDGATNRNFVVIEDRICAIEFALQTANESDCVVVCGKGGEEYMEIKGKKYPYSDKKVCLAVLEQLRCRK